MARGPESEEIHVDVEGRTLRLTNLAKVLYPRTGTTKGEVLDYYARIAPTMLPHLKDRAVTRIRWPHGVQDLSFFEKNAPSGTPSWVRTVTVPTTGSRGPSKNGDTLVFPVVDDLATLTWLANLAALELHVHQWKVGRNGRPRNADRLVKLTRADGTEVTGRITASDEESVVVDVDGTPHEVAYDDVAKALVQIEFNRKSGTIDTSEKKDD